MNKIVVDKTFVNDTLNVNEDSYIIVNNDVQANSFCLNIINCKATIIDMSNIANKVISFVNSEGCVVEITSESEEKNIHLINENSVIDYSIIDFLDEDVNYLIEDNTSSRGANTNINVASVSYKGKNKSYKINTSNLSENTKNEIDCFGIVKDKSILNYDVSSYIEKGAKKSVVRQNSHILLFDKESVGKNNPILLIEENDVKASHGSSIGKIDDDTMFYLCSRGLSKNEATNLICLGKIDYLIKKIEDKEIRESLVNKFRERMS